MSDNLIIDSIKKKDETGMEVLIRCYGGLITAIVRKHLYNIQSVEEECIDDILLTIWNNIKSFDRTKNTFKNWVAAISKYTAINYKKKYLRQLDQEDVDSCILEAKDNTEKALLEKELREEIFSLLNNLSAEDKEIFIKHYLQDKDIDSVSREMNLKTSVLYNRLSRGRRKLKSIINTVL